MEELVKKLLLPLLALSILALLSGCTTPQAVDMTGKWNYKYGKKLEDSGSMKLTQKGYDVTGVANNKDGQYQIEGRVTGETFIYKGTSEENTFNSNCELTSDSEFEGDYTTDTGTSGKIEAERK